MTGRTALGQQRNRSLRVVPFLRYAIGAAVTGAIVFGATVFGVAVYLVRRVTRPKRSRRPPTFTFTPWEFGIPFETLRITIGGTDELDAWLLAQESSTAPVIMILSGHGGNKSELLGIASALHRSGFACLLFDYRGTGLSSGSVITLGHHETDDARTVLDWIVAQRPDAPIGVLGYSLGGSVAINLAATDDRIRAVVTDSAFATQYGVLAHHVRRAIRVRPEPVLAAAAPMFRRKHQRGYSDFAPADLIHMIAPRPLLMIHPEHDRMVPMTEAMHLWENAREPKELWFVRGAEHCGAYFQDREGYCRRVSMFFSHSLQNPRT